MITLLRSILVAALLLLPAAAHAQAKGTRAVLVMDLAAKGVSADVAAQATHFIAEALEGREGLSVLTMEDVRALLNVEKMQNVLGCESDVACLVDLSRGARAELLVNGAIGQVGDTITLTVTLIDALHGVVSQRASVVMASVAELPEKMRTVVDQLFGFAAAPAAFKLPSGASLSFAVLDLAANGVNTDVAANLTQILSTEIKRVEGASVVSRQDIQAMLELEAAKSSLGCDDMSCLAEIGGALGVQRLVVGSVGRLASSHVISLRLIRVKDARVENRVTEAFTGSEEQLIRAVRHAGRRLLGVGEGRQGTLAVSASEEGAALIVDGEERGVLPMPPLAGLPAGRHDVKVRKGGFYDWTGEVYVDPDDTSALWVPLSARPTPWYLRWYVWTVAGGVVTAAVLGTVILVGSGVAGVFFATRPDPPANGKVTVE